MPGHFGGGSHTVSACGGQSLFGCVGGQGAGAETGIKSWGKISVTHKTNISLKWNVFHVTELDRMMKWKNRSTTRAMLEP